MPRREAQRRRYCHRRKPAACSTRSTLAIMPDSFQFTPPSCGLRRCLRPLLPTARADMEGAVAISDDVSGQPTDDPTKERGRRRYQAANRRVRLRPRSTCPKSSAPAFEVIAPPSKQATTALRPTASNANRRGVHSVGIGALQNQREIAVAQYLSLILRPDAPNRVWSR
jgi:hypothetical protein